VTADGGSTTAGRGRTDQPWLVVIDMQVVFGDPGSEWFTPRFPEIVPAVRRLVDAFGDRVVYTRFIAPEKPQGSWVPYYEQWPFALVAPDHPIYEMWPEFPVGDRSVVSCDTFGKWGGELDEAIRGSREIVLAGVSTDCCVMSTALGAADAGVHVRVASDACAGVSDEDHERALSLMSLYGPLVEVASVDDILSTPPGARGSGV